jgi:hypothetical protein
MNGPTLRMYCTNVHCAAPNNIQVALLDAEVEDRVFGYIERLAPSTIKEVDPGRPDLKAAEAAEAALKDAEYARDKFLDNLEAISILGQARWNVQAAKYTKAVEVALGRLAAAEGQLAETRELSRVPLREEWPNLPLTRRREIIFTLVRTLVVAPVYGKRGVAGSERVKVRLMGGAMAKRWILPDGAWEQMSDSELERYRDGYDDGTVIRWP